MTVKSAFVMVCVCVCEHLWSYQKNIYIIGWILHTCCRNTKKIEISKNPFCAFSVGGCCEVSVHALEQKKQSALHYPSDERSLQSIAIILASLSFMMCVCVCSCVDEQWQRAEERLVYSVESNSTLLECVPRSLQAKVLWFLQKEGEKHEVSFKILPVTFRTLGVFF